MTPFEPPVGARLEILGASTIQMSVFSDVTLNVRYVDAAGAPIPSGTISFAIEDGAAGASLSATNIVSAADGTAAITLRSGEEASFPVVAVANGASPVSWVISVRDMGNAGLNVTATYAGRRSIGNVQIGVFNNFSCDQFNVPNLPTPFGSGMSRVGRPYRFNEVPVGAPLAIWAFGLNDFGRIATAACSNASIAGEADVTVPMADVAMLRGGTYAMEEVFDVTEGFTPELNFVLEALEGLTSDPAGYLLDLAIASLDLPSWARSVLSTGSVRAIARDLINEVIKDIRPPAELVELAQAGADLNHAFSQLKFLGTLTLDEVDEFGKGTGLHELREIQVPLRDGTFVTRTLTGNRANVELTFTEADGMTLGEHSFTIPFGRIVETVLNETLLPRLPGSPGSTAELVGSIIQCDEVARTLVAGADPLIQSATETACNIAVLVIAQQVNDQITQLWSYDVLTLSGNGDVYDDDYDYVADRFVGTANARWTGSSGELAFMGTLNGTRQSAVMPRDIQRVFDKIRELR